VVAKLLHESGFARLNRVVDIEGAKTDLVEQEGTLLRAGADAHPRDAPVRHGPGPRGPDDRRDPLAGVAESARLRQVFAFDTVTLAP
jgi:hypothetical protein